jgi:adenosine/AMP kinase
MEPILKLTQIIGKDDSIFTYKVTITNGAELIQTKEDLMDALKTSVPGKRGIIKAVKVNESNWVIEFNK